jgi:hypothetical protein
MEKATIKIVAGSQSVVGQSIPVMFNPTDYQITRNMSYAEIGVPGLAMPLLQFVRGEAQVLTLELFLDASDRVGSSPLAAASSAVSSAASPGAVSVSSNSNSGINPTDPGQWQQLGTSPYCEHRLLALRHLVELDSELHAPCVVMFSWAGDRFQGVVTSYTEKFTMFDDGGHLLRARVSLSLKSYTAAETQFQQINPQSPDRTKTHVVQIGDRLDAIAADVYGDPEQWRVIATANGITRPRILVAGTLLVIPPLS